MKKIVFLAIALTFAFNPLANAQQEDAQQGNETANQEKPTKARQSLIFSKQKTAWQVGIFGGVSTLMGDVSPNFFGGSKPGLPGHNIGIFVSKSWTYLFSTRLKYSNMVMFTNNPVASTLTSNQFDYLEKYSSGLNGYSPGNLFFHNSRTQAHDVTLDLVFSLGNINFNKDRSAVVFKIFPTAGVLMYQTFYDHLDANGNAYDYASINKLYANSSTTRADVLKALSAMRDGKYETRAERQGPKFGKKETNYNNRFVYGFGFGAAFRVTEYLSIDIETRQMITKDDLLDGTQWLAPNPYSSNSVSAGRSKGGDVYNQTTIGVTYSIMPKNTAESRNMDNPLSGTDAFTPTKSSNTKKADKNTVQNTAIDSVSAALDSINTNLNNKVETLENQVNRIDSMLKTLGEAEKQNSEKIKELDKVKIQEPIKVQETVKGQETTTNTNTTSTEQSTNSSKNTVLKPNNDMSDESFKLKNGEYIYVASLEGDKQANYYLIIGSFRVKSNATRDQRTWADKGVNTTILLDIKDGLYRLAVDYTNDHTKALEMLDEYKAKLNRDIWLIKSK